MTWVFPKAKLLNLFTVLFIVAVAWDIYLYFLPDHLQMANYLLNVVEGVPCLLIGAIIIYSLRQSNAGGEIARSLGYLALGAIILGLAITTWTYYNLVLYIPVPHPSVDEAFYAVYPFLLTYGTVRLLRFYTGLLNWKVALEALVVFLLAAVPLTIFVVLPSFDQETVLISSFITLGVVTGNALLLSVVYLTIRLGGGRLRWLLSLYGASYLLFVASIFLFVYESEAGLYWNGGLVDAITILHIFGFCFAYIYTLDTLFNPPPPTIA